MAREIKQTKMQRAAGRIVEELFAHGATRLALKAPNDKPPYVGEVDLGGWCKQAVREVVLRELGREWPR